MKDLKYLQKLLFLLVMGFSLNLVCACGDDEEDEPFDAPNQEQNGNNSNGTEGGGASSTDGITSPTDDPVLPNDSVPWTDEPVLPNDSTLEGEDEPILPSETIMVAGHEAVDLGLSVMWATCNIGASSSEEYGGYFAWGETEEKSDYDWDTYKWCKGDYNSMTKYCTSKDYGKPVDNKTVLDPEDDVAHVQWGGSWRMPTADEINELRNNCTWKWTSQNGFSGMLVIGSNGNSIFLPAAGYRLGADFDYRGLRGEYWSATLSNGNSSYACHLHFDDGYRFFYYYFRNYGRSVRPVTNGVVE